VIEPQTGESVAPTACHMTHCPPAAGPMVSTWGDVVCVETGIGFARIIRAGRMVARAVVVAVVLGCLARSATTRRRASRHVCQRTSCRRSHRYRVNQLLVQGQPHAAFGDTARGLTRLGRCPSGRGMMPGTRLSDPPVPISVTDRTCFPFAGLGFFGRDPVKRLDCFRNQPVRKTIPGGPLAGAFLIRAPRRSASAMVLR
jgi:hypothetical protein